MNFKKAESLRFYAGSVFFLPKGISALPLKILITLALVLNAVFLYVSGIGCAARYFLGIPCPGCGMTRALLALLRGDVIASLKYHFMLFSVPVFYLYFLFDGRIFKNKKVNTLVLSLIITGFILRWILNFVFPL